MGTPNDDVITVNGAGYAEGNEGNDILHLHSNAGSGASNEIHGNGDEGDDILNLGFQADSGNTFRSGHHVYGDIEGATLPSQQGNDVFNFTNVNNVGAGSLAVGRIQDYDDSRDTIQIEGFTLDLRNPQAFTGVPGVTFRIVEFNGAIGSEATTSSEPQQFLLITNANGGTIFYALEGARASTVDTFIRYWDDGVSHREEVHFLGAAMIPGGTLAAKVAYLESLPSVPFVDRQNVIPDGFSPGANGLYINDDDGAFGVPRTPAAGAPGFLDLAQFVAAPINGSAFADVIAAGLNNDHVNAGAGNDTVWGGSGYDTILGGEGHDSLLGGSGNDSLVGEAGNDTLSGESGDDSVWGGEGDDHVWGSGGNDQVAGGAGNDQVAGGDGNDTLWGNDGNDTMWGGTGVDFLYGGNDNDLMYGNGENDVVSGEGGSDTLHGGDGNDSVWGGTGDDFVWGEAGNDDVAGGDGNDQVGGGSGNDTLWGSNGNDTLWGGVGADQMDGGNDDDLMYGEGDNDQVSGGAGNDTLYGNDGDDSVWGGDGNDSVSGDNGNDQVAGGNGNDTVWGGGGNDTVWGGSGADTLYGDGGADILYGEASNDIIYGGQGADTLVGGEGRDYLYGGPDSQRDVFIFTSPSESAVGSGRDQIHEFGAQDVIDLSQIDANGAASGNQSFSFNGTTAAAHSVWYAVNGGNSFVRGDVNGDGVADFEIQIVGVTSLNASDFIL